MRPALTRSLLLAVLSCLSALRLVVTSPLFDYDPASCLSNIDVEDEVRAVGVEERGRVLRHADQAATGDDDVSRPTSDPKAAARFRRRRGESSVCRELCGERGGDDVAGTGEVILALQCHLHTRSMPPHRCE